MDPFTYEAYAAHLRDARELGFTFTAFDDPDPTPPLLYLRHDIDFSPQWVHAMLAIEDREKARATWFFQIDSRNYDIAALETARAIEAISDRAGWLGAHVEANHLDDDADVVALVSAQAAALGERFGVSVRAVSFHMPTRRRAGYSHLELPDGLVNTYAPRFFRDVGYVSDSNQDWRGKDLATELRRHDQLQLLIHPMWWREEYEPMLPKLKTHAASVGVELDELLTAEQRTLIDG